MMKNFFIFSLVTLVLAVSCRHHKEQQPLQLWYNQPAGNCEEALPLGNGLTGAMVFGGISTEQFGLNDNTLWSGGPNPGNQITPLHTPELARAAKQTLIHRGDFSTGWSMAWKLNWWARLKDGNQVYKMSKDGLTYVGEKTEVRGSEGTSTNLFTNAHGAVQVEGNFGGTAGIAELLVQSHDGYIHLLPALPDELSSGEVKGLVARGGFVNDMKWENGLLETVVIQSRLGGNCRIKVTGNLTSRNARLQPAEGENPNYLLAKPDPVPHINNAQVQPLGLTPDPGNIYDFITKAGHSYQLIFN